MKNGVYWVYDTEKDGRPVGEGLAYDTTGKLVGRETYRRGFTHGDLVWYRSSRKEGVDRALCRKGFRHGTAMQYDSLDRKIHSITFREGIKHRPSTCACPEWSRSLSHGESLWTTTWYARRSYHTNGLVEWTGGFRDGKMHGERILRDSTGTLYNGEYLTTFPMGMGRYRVACTPGPPPWRVDHAAQRRKCELYRAVREWSS